MQSLFGTDGIRSTVGKEPLTADSLIQLGRAIGQWITQKSNQPKVVLGHDPRFSSDLCKSLLEAGLLEYPLSLQDVGLIPTPVLYHWTEKNRYDAGIMITASHNSAHDNGIKIFTGSGKLSAHDKKQINQLFYQSKSSNSFAHPGRKQFSGNIDEWYLQQLRLFFSDQFLAGKRIVLDCANGAYSSLAPRAFALFGAEVITLNTTPDGYNINKKCGSLHPETVQKAVFEERAHCGFAFDGDGDRVIGVGKKGDLKDGDDLLALLSTHNAYAKETVLVGTVMSNEGLSTHSAQQKKQLIRTPVGDTHVIEELKARNLLLGGEISGHIILGDFCYTADGLFAALRIAQALVATDNWEMKTFEKFPQITINLPVTEKKSLSKEPLASVIERHRQSLSGGRLLVRYSGTEPLLRIMVEAATEEQAHTLVKLVLQELTYALQSENHL